MNTCAESSDRTLRPLFQEGEGGSIPTSALQLFVERIPFEFALTLNKQWHSRLPRMGVGFIKRMPFLSYAATFEDRAFAVAVWSNPVARFLPQREWLELRRLAISSDAPRNTASRMLAVMARLIRKDKPEVERLVSYHDTEVHTGGIYRAAGWTPTILGGNATWNRPKRPRPKDQTLSPKQRWELTLD